MTGLDWMHSDIPFVGEAGPTSTAWAYNKVRVQDTSGKV